MRKRTGNRQTGLFDKCISNFALYKEASVMLLSTAGLFDEYLRFDKFPDVCLVIVIALPLLACLVRVCTEWYSFLHTPVTCLLVK
jgi:hypothetical protein